MELVLDPRFNGPPGSANGGYTCGVVARVVGNPAGVTLRRPPPLGRPLRIERVGEAVELRDGDALVAEAHRGDVDIVAPGPVDVETAKRAVRGYPGFRQHAFPTCFVCGPEREPGDGLRVFASPVPGRDVVAAPWVPAAALADADGRVEPEFVWAALDCPGAFAVGFAADRGETLLGRLAARVDRRPAAGERCVVVGWKLGEDGRKLYAGTALYSEGGELYAVARAIWIEPRSSR